MAIWLIILSLLLASPAQAEYLIVESFDMSDTQTSTNRDVFGWHETLSGSAIDADMRHILETSTKTWCHHDENGGDESSNGCVMVNAAGMAATSAIYWKPCEGYSGSDPVHGCDDAKFPLNGYTLSVSFGLAIDADAADGLSREILYIVEGDATPRGCELSIGDSRDLEVSYNGESLYTGSSYSIDENVCTSPYTYLPCVDNSDCPNNSCSSNKYLAGVKFTEISASPIVQCILEVNGRTLYDSGVYTPTTAVPGEIDTFYWGATNSSDTERQSIYYIDSMVVTDTSELGWGYVGTLTSCNMTGLNQWAASSGDQCGTNKKWECVNSNWDDSASYLYNATSLVRNETSGFREFQLEMGKRIATTTNNYTCGSYEPSLYMCQSGVDLGKVCAADSDCSGNDCESALVSGMSIDAMSAQAIGLTGTGSGGTFIFAVGMQQNAVTTKKFMGDCFSMTYDETNSRLLGTHIVERPTEQGTWADNDLERMNIVFYKCAGSTAHRHKVTEAAIYFFVSRSGSGIPRTLADGNKGTDDHLLVHGFNGDSLFYGTKQVSCVGGSAEGDECSEQTHCSWSTTRDQPIGGCLDDDELCQTCVGRFSEYNNNAGYLCDLTERWCQGKCAGGTQADADCDEDSDCPGSSCTLNTCDFSSAICVGGSDEGDSCNESGDTDCETEICRGTCTLNDLAYCDSNSDCTDLGMCQSTATCEDSCPDGGVCPDSYVPGEYAARQLNVDYAISWAQGGTTTYNMYNCFENILNGLCTSSCKCEAIVGVGRCSCDDSGDCGGDTCGTDATYCPYTPDTGCCTDSDAGYSSCTSEADCDAGFACVFPPIDQLTIMSGTNEQIFPGATYGHPNCEGPRGYYSISTSTGTSKPCACADNTLCTDDSDCPTGGACIGVRFTSPNWRCLNESDCIVKRYPCWTDDDCGPTFSDGDCSTSDYSAPYKNGVCGCDADSDCPSGYDCQNDMCRKICSSDSQCISGKSGSCDTSTTPDTCKGVCTCPSSSLDCDDNFDCITSDTNALWPALFGVSGVTIHGRCVGGKCECTGPSTCGEFPPLVCSDDGSSCTDTSDCSAGAACTGPCYYTYSTDLMSDTMTVEGKLLGLYYYDQMQAMIDALEDTDNKPKLVIAPPPNTANNSQDVRDAGGTPRPPCGFGHPNRPYLLRVRQELITDTTTYPNVIDLPEVFESYPQSETYGQGGLHFTSFSAQAVGERIAEWDNANNTCAVNTGDGGRLQKPQMYCRNLDGSWDAEDDTCDTDQDCDEDQRCEIQMCVCDCDIDASWKCAISGASCSQDRDCCSDGGTCTNNICDGLCAGAATCNKD